MENTDNVNELFTALSKAQIDIKVAVFDKKANYGAYASFKSVVEASREALAKNGLSIIQPVSKVNDKYQLHTILAHSSGQMIKSHIELILDKNNMQGLGSAITYAKRYAWSAMVGVVSDDDDDANAASGTNNKVTEKSSKAAAKPPDPANYVMPIGSQAVKGKKLRELSESKLNEIVQWLEEEMSRVPPPEGIQTYMNVYDKIEAFLKSMGVK